MHFICCFFHIVIDMLLFFSTNDPAVNFINNLREFAKKMRTILMHLMLVIYCTYIDIYSMKY